MRLYVLLSFAFCLTTLSWRLDSKRKALENHTTERLSKPFSNLYSISPRAQKPSEKTQLNFVSAPGDGHLYLNGALFDFRGFNVPTIFLGELRLVRIPLDLRFFVYDIVRRFSHIGGEYQCRDLLKSILGFGTPVGRAYTLQVANDVFPEGRTPASSAHIIGWDKGSDVPGNPSAKLDLRFFVIQWTLAVAEHLKSLAPNTLVMDGSFSRSPENAWDKDVLDSEYVELFSYHLCPYGNRALNIKTILKQSSSEGPRSQEDFGYRRAWILKAYSRFTCAGALAWSLRPHADTGGFLTNSEGYNIYSYHVPGWDTQATAMFDTQEAQVVGLTYNASYRLLGLEPPPRPIPGPPEPFLLTNGRQVGLSWRGSAWAKWYEVFGAAAKDSISAPVSNAVYDNVEAGELFVALDPQTPTKFLNATRHLGKTPESHSGWSDQKWCVAGSQGSCSFTIPSKDRQQAQSAVRLGHGLYTVVPRMNSTSAGNFNEGGWYSVRGISADGVPGEYSEAVFVGTDWV
ncbi:hypothetical protein O181_018581 [Austropuccinia psidii MF-1]|uniref:Uncharacterized protein n=1 Tax=Austropuccinia psidii MF-1 TaxID=1389203 RepID=A0A9Q3C9W5_9BASI|nr:hypothetical protein [Austropuccinia psidii MF-1]